jgi:hypothetical protein
LNFTGISIRSELIHCRPSSRPIIRLIIALSVQGTCSQRIYIRVHYVDLLSKMGKVHVHVFRLPYYAVTLKGTLVTLELARGRWPVDHEKYIRQALTAAITATDGYI